MHSLVVVLLCVVALGLLVFLAWAITAGADLFTERATRIHLEKVNEQLRESLKTTSLQLIEANAALTACKERQIITTLGEETSADPVDAANAALRAIKDVS